MRTLFFKSHLTAKDNTLSDSINFLYEMHFTKALLLTNAIRTYRITIKSATETIMCIFSTIHKYGKIEFNNQKSPDLIMLLTTSTYCRWYRISFIAISRVKISWSCTLHKH